MRLGNVIWNGTTWNGMESRRGLFFPTFRALFFAETSKLIALWTHIQTQLWPHLNSGVYNENSEKKPMLLSMSILLTSCTEIACKMQILQMPDFAVVVHITLPHITAATCEWAKLLTLTRPS